MTLSSAECREYRLQGCDSKDDGDDNHRLHYNHRSGDNSMRGNDEASE